MSAVEISDPMAAGGPPAKQVSTVGREIQPVGLGVRLAAFPEDSTGSDLKAKWPTGISNENILSHYIFDRIVGQGYTGKVRLAALKEDDSRLYAVKSISKLQVDDKEGKYFHAEANVLKELDHPNIIKFYECYQDSKNYHLVLEACEGNDLVKLVEKKKGLPESLIKKYFHQAVYAVNYLQHMGVCHRDIKLDNFLLTSSDESQASIRLIDFGFTAIYRGKELSSLVGTPWYVAPEILDKSKPYTYLCDNWSLGVVLYMMIFARPPFMGRNHAELYGQIASKHIDYSEPQFQKLSPELLKILKGLLCKDPSKRLSLPQVLQSPWFDSQRTQTFSIWMSAEADHILQKLRDKKRLSKFEQLFSQQLVKAFSDCEEVAEADRYFHCCDRDLKGHIGAGDIRRIADEAGRLLPAQELGEILSQWTETWGGLLPAPQISYTEFISGILPKKFFADPDSYFPTTLHRLHPTSSDIESDDIAQSGRITSAMLVSYFRKIGYTISEEVARGMICEFLGEEGSEISYEALCGHYQQSDSDHSVNEESFYKVFLDSSGST